MRHSGLIKLILKVILVSLPLSVPLAIYSVCDPFQVLRHYDRFYADSNIVYNRDYVSTEIFLENYPKEHYDSFIFGNSRSLAFQCGEWRRHIRANGVYHFDANVETLYGIYKKIMFLDRQGVRLNNCLLVLDEETLAKIDNHTGHLLIKHPKISQAGAIDFQMEFVRAFLTPRYFMGYLDYRMHGRVNPKYGSLFMPNRVSYDPVTNDTFITGPEEELARTGNGYYEKRRNIFYRRERREKVYSAPRILETQKSYLEEIKRIFDKNNTSYRLVISPLYDQAYFNRADLACLESIFGRENVFDYSGVNEFTDSIYSYYETSHYRPFVGSRILEEIYRGKK